MSKEKAALCLFLCIFDKLPVFDDGGIYVVHGNNCLWFHLGTLNPCHVLNGGCEDICSVAIDSRVQCSCSEGKVLHSDGIRCTGESRS